MVDSLWSALKYAPSALLPGGGSNYSSTCSAKDLEEQLQEEAAKLNHNDIKSANSLLTKWRQSASTGSAVYEDQARRKWTFKQILCRSQAIEFVLLHVGGMAFPGCFIQEEKKSRFCTSHHKFHTVVVEGVRNISDTCIPRAREIFLIPYEISRVRLHVAYFSPPDTSSSRWRSSSTRPCAPARVEH